MKNEEMVRISFTIRDTDKQKWVKKARELGFIPKDGERGLSLYIKDLTGLCLWINSRDSIGPHSGNSYWP